MPGQVTNFRREGDAILERTESLAADVLAPVQPYLDAFAKVHHQYGHACDAADVGREARDAAIAHLALQDKALDAALLALADRLVGAGLGTRKNPFSAYGPHAPGALADLGYERSVKATRELVQKIVAVQPPAEVHKATQACLKAATAVEKALAAVQGPQAKFEMAMGTRDGMLPGWSKARDRFKKHAAAAWLDLPEVYKAVFKALRKR